MKKILIVISLFISGTAKSADTTYLGIDSFLLRVFNHHPVAKIADLQNEKGKAIYLKAKGGFDPVVSAYFNEKGFNDIDYYQYAGGQIKIPLWPGIDFESGIEQNAGQYLNKENSTPSSGLMFTGISVPLARGLITDARRNAVQKARIEIKINENARIQILNELMFSAAADYLMWWQAWQEVMLHEKLVGIAGLRLDLVRNQFQLGEKAAIDTLEAHMQLQNRQVSLQIAKLKLLEWKLKIAYYLWDETTDPLPWMDSYYPDIQGEIFVAPPMDALKYSPELEQIMLRISNYGIERKLMKEMLKPSLQLKYHMLSFRTNALDYQANNMRLGLQFSMPVFIRKERGDLKLVDLYLTENHLKLKAKNIEWQNAVSFNAQEITTYRSQLGSYNEISDNTFQLLQSELIRLESGESTLMMVNLREQMYLQAMLQLQDCQVNSSLSVLKYRKLCVHWEPFFAIY